MKPMAHSSDEVIALSNLGKWFWSRLRTKKWAVRGLTIRLDRGETVGLLGPNGSGKSTTIKMLLGFLQPSEGTIKILGSAPRARSARASLGYLPENPRLPRFLTARQCLSYFGQLYGLTGAALARSIDRNLELVRLQHARHERIQGFSKGMVQRLAFAQSLMNEAQVLILDEPMSGLDPLGRMEIRNLLQSIRSERPMNTILFSTHILSDVEELCTSVILLKNGSMITHSPISSILETGKQTFEVLVQNVNPHIPLPVASSARPTGDGRIRFTASGTQELTRLLQELERSHGEVIRVESRQNRLEEVLFGEQQV